MRPLEVSLKLSALGQALDRDGEKIALENAHTICERAEQVGAWVTVDAEDHTTTDSTLSIAADLQTDFPWLGVVLQAYLRRTHGDCEQFAASGVRVRLCKGAYDEPASVAYRDAAAVTDSYLRCLRVLMAGRGIRWWPRTTPWSSTRCPHWQANTGGVQAISNTRCCTASVTASSYGWRPPATGFGSMCRSAPSGTGTSCAGWPSDRPT